jgi:hypothetical protein
MAHRVKACRYFNGLGPETRSGTGLDYENPALCAEALFPRSKLS